MRLHILDDLHLEFGTAKIPATDADVVVLAGDVHLGRERDTRQSSRPEKSARYRNARPFQTANPR